MATLLVVDDDPDVLDLTASLLRDGGYRVLSAPGGPEALALLERETVDLVLTDVVMPGMTGFELVERARRHRPDLPAIYMSGYFDSMSATPALSRYKLLAKPWKPRELLREIGAAIEREAPLA